MPSTVTRNSTWIGAAFLAVLIIVGLASGGTPRVMKGRVLVIGDSLTEFSTGEVESALTSAGWDAVVDGRGGWNVSLWRRQIDEVATFVQADVAVVALGTNDCDKKCAPLGSGIDSIVTSLLDSGVREIFWLNVQEFPIYPTYSKYVNDEIERAVVRWRQVKIVDLDGTFVGHPEWHLADNLHFNEIGAQQFAGLIARVLGS